MATHPPQGLRHRYHFDVNLPYYNFRAGCQVLCSNQRDFAASGCRPGSRRLSRHNGRYTYADYYGLMINKEGKPRNRTGPLFSSNLLFREGGRSRTCILTYNHLGASHNNWCPSRDSNSDCLDPKSNASANWARRALN